MLMTAFQASFSSVTMLLTSLSPSFTHSSPCYSICKPEQSRWKDPTTLRNDDHGNKRTNADQLTEAEHVKATM
jgi:hypothetical protein